MRKGDEKLRATRTEGKRKENGKAECKRLWKRERKEEGGEGRVEENELVTYGGGEGAFPASFVDCPVSN